MRDIWCIWIVRVLSAAQEAFVGFEFTYFWCRSFRSPSLYTHPPFSLFWCVSWLSFDFCLVMIACGGVRVVCVELCYLSVSVSFSSVYFAYLYVLTSIRLGVGGCISASKCFDFECLSVVLGVSG